MTDDWNLYEQHFHLNIEGYFKVIKDANGLPVLLHDELYRSCDIETLRKKLIEDFKFHISKDYHYLLPQIKKLINKRFGREKNDKKSSPKYQK